MIYAWRKSFRDVLLERKSYKEALMTNMLSPEAETFHPVIGEDVNGIIYNDGLPSLKVVDKDHEFVKGFSDATLDEAFPPNAQEAAELEACEQFNETLAHLDMLEHREEVSRLVRTELHKRWEALTGKRPRVATRSVIDKAFLTSNEDSIPVYDHSASLLEHRLRARERSRMHKRRVQKKNNFMKASFMKPIHQPRRGRY